MAEELLLQSQKAYHHRLIDNKSFEEIKKKAKAQSEEVREDAGKLIEYLKFLSKLRVEDLRSCLRINEFLKIKTKDLIRTIGALNELVDHKDILIKQLRERQADLPPA